MPDVCPANDELLAAGGSDRGLLTDCEKENNDTSRLTHSTSNKKVLCQYEGAAGPAKSFCMVMQEKKHVWSYALFHIRLTIQDASADTFEIYPDAIANNQASDLR